MAVLVTILGIGFLIFVHELGHFAVAKAVGMRVLTFSLGFGPAIWRVRRGDTSYQISVVPIGGYVLVDSGADAEEAAAASADAPPTAPAAHPVDDPMRYENRPVWAKLGFIFAGPLMNWLFAAALAIVMLAIGLPEQDVGARVGRVEPERPAAKAGVRDGDAVRAVAGTPVETWEEMRAAFAPHAGAAIPFVVEREGASLTLTIVPDDGGGRGVIGVYPSTTAGAPRGLGTAIVDGLAFTVHQSVELMGRIAAMVGGGGEGKLLGIPGIGKMVKEAAERGVVDFLLMLFMLSLSLALFNLLPIPGLDGGRLALLTAVLVLRRKLSTKVEGWVNLVGLALVLGLIVFVSLRDLYDIYLR